MTFADGTAGDGSNRWRAIVTTFLMYAAEPHMDERKRTGLKGGAVPGDSVRHALLREEEGLGGRALAVRCRQMVPIRWLNRAAGLLG